MPEAATAPTLERVPCNLCGADDAETLYEALDGWPASAAEDYAATTDRYGAYGRIARCRRCGLAYTNPRVAASTLLAEYARTTDEPYVEQCEARSMNAYLALAAIRRHARGGKLLEIGCSAGFFLNAARLAFEVTGVEPSSWARAYARERLKLDVPGATLDDADLAPASFDVAAAIDVIEHVGDPAALLRGAARVLKPGGLLYLVTPDLGSVSARVLGPRWWGLRPAHVYYFTRATLAAMLERAGFQIVEMRSYGRIFTYDYWLSRLANYPRPLSRTIEAGIDAFGVRDKFLYIDTRDSVQVIARRKA